MPKLYEYFGLIVLFYSNEHEPLHVRGKCKVREGKAELVVVNGSVSEIKYSSVRGRRPLTRPEMKKFQTLTEHFADEIVQKWIDYFVLHRQIEAKQITQRIK
ncbi:MAG TPA: DUF4160 domain-containing protein [Blastocatellia bacterium]|nr:DUF4160 domain-containing protein [Blastocatellia bacterium]